MNGRNRKPIQQRVTLPEIELKRSIPIANPKLIYPYGRYSEQEYLSEMAGKKVIIVGPAGYLEGRAKGNWIDSFDVVVRINHAIPILNTKDYGSRTDVLYHILSHRGAEDQHKKLVVREEIEEWQESGLKWLVSSHGPLSDRIKIMGPIIDGAFPWTCVHDRFAARVKKQIGKKSPNTGITAILHLLSSNLRSLHITGFDFYSSGVYDGYGDLKEGEDAAEINERWHSIPEQKTFLKKIIQRDNRVVIDSHLQGVLNQ